MLECIGRSYGLRMRVLHSRAAELSGVARRLLLVIGCAMVVLIGPLGAGSANAQPVQQDTRTEEVEFQSHGTTLHGTVYLPSGAVGRLPGVVLVHGAGKGPRAQYVPEAETFARAGIVTLAFDKRTDGYSVTHRDYAQLADDALAGVELLRTRPDVDASKVGLWGLSEGAWVSPIAAAKSPDVAFVVTIGGSGQPPLRQSTWAADNLLRHHGVSGSLLDAVAGPGGQFLDSLGVFPEADHDPAAVLRQVHQPVLALWGERDTQSPPAESARIFQQALSENPHATLRFVPLAAHNGHRTSDGFDRVGGAVVGGRTLGDLMPGYAEVITAWIHEVAAGNPPSSSLIGPMPRQEALSRPVSDGSWYESAFVRIGMLVPVLIGFLGYPLTAWIGSKSDATQSKSIRRWSGSLALLGIVTVVGTVGYMLWLFSFGGPTESAFFAGQPLVWLLLHILAPLVLLAAIATGFVWWRTRAVVAGAFRIRIAVLLCTAAIFIPWALSWRVLLPY